MRSEFPTSPRHQIAEGRCGPLLVARAFTYTNEQMNNDFIGLDIQRALGIRYREDQARRKRIIVFLVTLFYLSAAVAAIEFFQERSFLEYYSSNVSDNRATGVDRRGTGD